MARSLGATDEELDNTKPLPETADYIAHCIHVTRDGSFIEGMTAIGIGIEYFSPRFFAALAELFRSQFGLSREEVEYLLVHVGEDEDHARRSLELIEKYADTDEIKEKAKQALREMLSVKRRFAEALFAHCMNQTNKKKIHRRDAEDAEISQCLTLRPLRLCGERFYILWLRTKRNRQY